MLAYGARDTNSMEKKLSQITPSSSRDLLFLLPDMMDLASHHSFRANALLEDCLRLMLLLFEGFSSVSFLTLPSQLQYECGSTSQSFKTSKVNTSILYAL